MRIPVIIINQMSNKLTIRDPRSRMLEQQQERKISGPKRPDGAKLSFQEKMKLFAQEVTLNKANCDDLNINSQYSRLVRLHQETKLKSPRLRERLTLQVDFPQEEDLPVKLQRK